ncbi:hypothetical protein F4558_004376 [Micromonospora profundi]|uniref:hypothetical protein n=1 Tax=Micromonospora profundi TaxID=1420889 RepID=UPI0014393B26|nr:hypothetical protein [Micromonospora profundi]NJC14550.1 hypothetical protein [Micromonospora profundi]
MAKFDAKGGRTDAWAWPAGIMIGLAIGIPLFSSTGGVAIGVAFGIAIGTAFAIAFGATTKKADSRSATKKADGRTVEGEPQKSAGPAGFATDDGPAAPSDRDKLDGEAAGGTAAGPRLP